MLPTKTNGMNIMQKLIKTLIIISTVSALSAQAEDDLTAKFSYSPSDSIETTYANFEGTAKKACKIKRSEVAEMHTRSKMERDCRAELIDNAVAATPLQGLAAYHEQMTNSRIAAVFAVEDTQVVSAR